MIFSGNIEREVIKQVVQNLDQYLQSLDWQNTDTTQTNFYKISDYFNVDEFISDTYNRIGLVIDYVGNPTPVEIGNPYLVREPLRLQFVVVSSDADVAQDLAACVKTYFQLLPLIPLTDGTDQVGTVEVITVNASQIMPRSELETKQTRHWWGIEVGLEIIVSLKEV